MIQAFVLNHFKEVRFQRKGDNQAFAIFPNVEKNFRNNFFRIMHVANKPVGKRA
jgi:hypothetical protein